MAPKGSNNNNIKSLIDSCYDVDNEAYDWRYHHGRQMMIWERPAAAATTSSSDSDHADATVALVPPQHHLEIENVTVACTTKGSSDIYFDDRDQQEPFFLFKMKQPLNITIKLKSSKDFPQPVNTIQHITFEITYKGDLPSDTYEGEPKFCSVSKIDFSSSSDAIVFKNFRTVSHMTDLKKKIFNNINAKEKSRFNMRITLWSGSNTAYFDFPFKLTVTAAKSIVKDLEGKRKIIYPKNEHAENVDTSPIQEARLLSAIAEEKKMAEEAATRDQASEQQSRRTHDTTYTHIPSVTTSVQPSSVAVNMPYSINFESLRAIIDCDTLDPTERAPRLFATSEDNNQIRLETETGEEAFLDIFSARKQSMPEKFSFFNATQVSGISPKSLPANSVTTTVTLKGQFPFHNILTGTFDVTFGDVSCESIQKISPNQIVVVPPAHPPCDVEVKVFFTEADDGERVQIPAENDVNPTFSFTDEPVTAPPQNLYGNVDPLGVTRLHRACATGDMQSVVVFLTEKDSPFEKDNFGWTSFHRACASRRLGICKLLFLITRGAIMEHPDYRGLAALSLPALDGDIEFVTEFWNWIREVKVDSASASVQTLTNNGVEKPDGPPVRPLIPGAPVPSITAPETEYRRIYIAGCTVAESYLPRANVNNFTLLAVDESPLEFNLLRGTTLLLFNKPMKILSPSPSVKAIALGLNHPHFSRKQSTPLYFGYSSDAQTVRKVSSTVEVVKDLPADNSIILPTLQDFELPPQEVMYRAHGAPAFYFSLYIDIFMEETLEKMSVFRFDIPIAWNANVPDDQIAGTPKSLKQIPAQDGIELQNPIPLTTSTSTLDLIMQPYRDMLKHCQRKSQGSGGGGDKRRLSERSFHEALSRGDSSSA